MARIVLELEENIKEDFAAATKQNDTDISKELRSYIKKYIAKNKKEEEEKDGK